MRVRYQIPAPSSKHANINKSHPGQPCGKAKRVATPEPEPEAKCGYVRVPAVMFKSTNINKSHPGQPCGKAKREATPEPEPEAQQCGYVVIPTPSIETVLT